MKVFELMSLLQGARAGADVIIGSPYTANTHIASVEVAGEVVQITSSDTVLFGPKGNELGLLSKLATTGIGNE